jgi:hypothetical protein
MYSENSRVSLYSDPAPSARDVSQSFARAEKMLTGIAVAGRPPGSIHISPVF